MGCGSCLPTGVVHSLLSLCFLSFLTQFPVAKQIPNSGFPKPGNLEVSCQRVWFHRININSLTNSEFGREAGFFGEQLFYCRISELSSFELKETQEMMYSLIRGMCVGNKCKEVSGNVCPNRRQERTHSGTPHPDQFWGWVFQETLADNNCEKRLSFQWIYNILSYPVCMYLKFTICPDYSNWEYLVLHWIFDSLVFDNREEVLSLGY